MQTAFLVAGIAYGLACVIAFAVAGFVKVVEFSVGILGRARGRGVNPPADRPRAV